jgi:hypothetical protein
MNGKNVYDPGMPVNVSTTDNAMAFVVFDPAVGENFPTTLVPFADETVPIPQANFINNNSRDYSEMDPVLIFDLEGFTGPNAVIPEPTSIGLALVAISGLLLGLRSRRSASEI